MRRSTRAFTLIELMIVVAIIAILVSIAVPSFLRSRIAGNEVSCQATLKQIVSTEGVWRQTAASRDGRQDYWTNDVAGFYAFTDGAGENLHFLDVRVALADAAGWPRYTLPPFNLVGTTYDKSGYFFTAMTTDESGSPYQYYVGGSTFGTNPAKFAFCGYPRLYPPTGLRQYIVNEMGVVYAKELGLVPPTTTWPAADPSTLGWNAAD